MATHHEVYLDLMETEALTNEDARIEVTNCQLGELSVPLHVYPSGWDYIPENLHDKLQDHITRYAIDNYALTREEAVASIKSELKQDDEGLAALKGIKESSKNASEEEAKILERELQKNAFYFYKLDTKDGSECYINLDSVNAAENSFVTPIVGFLKNNEQTKAQFDNPQDVIYLLGVFKRDPQAADVVLFHVSDDVKRSKELTEYAALKGIDLKTQDGKTEHIQGHEGVVNDVAVPKLAEVAHNKRSRR
ncbi:hypothetical protein MAFF241648_21400 [Ralstonia solanacearum]|nr:hypothetical protein MAFF241648_21400 [Ralstonia solanacearum]